jgi:lysophospholipase L1-like esterase
VSRKRAILVNVLVSVAALCVAWAAIDAAAFFLVGLRSARHGMDDLIQFSPVVGHFHSPYGRGRYYPQAGRTGYDVAINSYGFADDERDRDKKRPRIALVGDSTTECWEVDLEDRPQRVLETTLDGRFEVLNLGVRGFGTDQTYVLLKQVGMGFDPDIIIYTFCVNDLRDNANERAKPYFRIDAGDTSKLVLSGYPIRCKPAEGSAAQEALWRYSLVYRTFRRAASRIESVTGRGAERGRATLPIEQNAELRPYRADYDDEDRRRWHVTRLLITAMQDEASARGARFLVVEDIYRPVLDPGARQEITAGYSEEFDFDKVTRLLESFTRERGIAFVSLAAEATARGVHAGEVMPPSDTIHLNAAGIRLWCLAVSSKLESLGWLEEDAGPREAVSGGRRVR